MTREPAPDPARDELLRLLNGLDTYRAWRIEAVRKTKGTITAEDLNEIVVPGSFFLELFDGSAGRSRAQIVKEVRLWYAHAASDLVAYAALDEDARRDVEAFLAAFRESVGFDFHSQAGLLRQTADRVLRAGRIARRQDYHALQELECDLSQTVVSPDEMAALARLLRRHEQAS